jgi:hypothetical protein
MQPRVLADRLMVASPRATTAAHAYAKPGGAVKLPKPAVASIRARAAIPLGALAVELETVRLTYLDSEMPLETSSESQDPDATVVLQDPEESKHSGQATATIDVKVQYLPVRKGLARLGSLRVFMLDEPAPQEQQGEDEPGTGATTVLSGGGIRLVGEWESCGEVWVQGT